MQDFNKKLKERWQTKRTKAFNWTSLIIKVLILVAILYTINRLSRSDNVQWTSSSAIQDSVQVDSLR